MFDSGELKPSYNVIYVFFISYLYNVYLIYWFLPFFLLNRHTAIPAVMPTPLTPATLLPMVMVIKESIDPSEKKATTLTSHFFSHSKRKESTYA